MPRNASGRKRRREVYRQMTKLCKKIDDAVTVTDAAAGPSKAMLATVMVAMMAMMGYLMIEEEELEKKLELMRRADRRRRRARLALLAGCAKNEVGSEEEEDSSDDEDTSDDEEEKPIPKEITVPHNRRLSEVSSVPGDEQPRKRPRFETVA